MNLPPFQVALIAAVAIPLFVVILVLLSPVAFVGWIGRLCGVPDEDVGTGDYLD